MKGTKIGIPMMEGNNITEMYVKKIVSLKWNSLYVKIYAKIEPKRQSKSAPIIGIRILRINGSLIPSHANLKLLEMFAPMVSNEGNAKILVSISRLDLNALIAVINKGIKQNNVQTVTQDTTKIWV